MNSLNLTSTIEQVCQQIASVTGKRAGDIDVDMPFMSMGIESLQAVTIISNIATKIGRTLDPTLMFDYPTVRRLAEFLIADPIASSSRGEGEQASTFTINEPIAIIGMSCRFPKAGSIPEFWQLLQNGVDAISEIPASRTDLVSSEAPPWGGFIESIDSFDNDAFSLADPEADRMDPQQRLLLEATWTAIEDAGYAPSEFSGTRTGVFVGISSSDYSMLGAKNSRPGHIYDATGNAHCIAANRISYLFNLLGPSVSLDTACSSSLVAIHQACTSLKMRETDAAVTAGVNVLLTSSLSVAFAQAQMLAPDGRCKTFSDQANGYVRGEGVGVVILKRLADAKRDGDRVWGVIRGSAVNQDGKSSGLTAPSGPAQEAVIRQALVSGELVADDISYIEAHGTGTPLGDPIEYAALSRVLGPRAASGKCKLGSVKTNIGHLEAAAGIAGVIKTVLSLHHRWIPKSLHCQNLNTKINEVSRHLDVETRGSDWTGTVPRRAGVSSFGFGGTNAHIILEEAAPADFGTGTEKLSAPTLPTNKSLTSDVKTFTPPLGSHWWLTLSASSSVELKKLARDMNARLQAIDENEAKLLLRAASFSRNDLAHRLVVHAKDRTHFVQRLILASGQDEVISRGENKIADDPTTKVIAGDVSKKPMRPPPSKNGLIEGRLQKRTPKIAFLYTGQGSQSPGMGLQLYQVFKTFRSSVDDCCEGFDRYFEHNLFSVMKAKNESEAKLLAQTDYGQAALFTLGYALTQLLKKDFGLEPSLVLGHSLGEIIAAHVAGAIDLRDAIRLVTTRGQLMQSSAPGAMTVVFAGNHDVESILRLENLDLDIAAINGPVTTVVSGEPGAIERAETIFTKNGWRVHRLRVEQAFHSRLMDPVLTSFGEAASQLKFNVPTTPLISSLTGEAVGANPITYSALYWSDHLRRPTQFFAGMKTLEQLGANCFVEIGAHPTLIPMGQSCLSGTKANWISLQNRQQDGVDSFFQGLAELHAIGAHDSRVWLPKHRDVSLPKTTFQKKSHWALPLKPQDPACPFAEENMPMTPTNTSYRENTVLIELREMVGRLLQIDPNEFNVDEPLIDMGADSLLLLNAVQTIKDKYHVSIAISDVFQEVSTLRAMAHFIVSNTDAVPLTSSFAVPVSTQADVSTMSNQLLHAQGYPLSPQGNPHFHNQTSTLNNGTLQDLVHSQLQLMNLQLQLLQGQPSQVPILQPPPQQASTSTSNTMTSPAAPTAPTEKRGVLGNFKTFADREAMAVEDEKKAKYLQNLTAQFNERTKKTKAHTQKYRRPLADNRVSAGFRPNTKEIVYPIICKKAKGARFTDLDENEYIDFTMGFGVNLFGHSPDFIESKVREQIELGMCVGPQSFLAGEVAQLMCDLTGQERIAFCNSGTEAVMTALRLARAATKREKIVIFDGSYHGHSDGVLARAQGPGGQSLPVAPGVTRGSIGDVVVLEYGSPQALETIRQLAPQLAAVLVEPVQSRFPELQPVEFLREIRAITEKSGTAFIFDEVITGFRIHTGGAQAHFGIKADLASYGKVLGGGLPIGAIGGSARFMDALDGGHWNFGDTTFPQSEMTFFAGTFCKHPLAMAAAEAVLKKLKVDGQVFISDLNQRTTKLKNELNVFFQDRGLDLHVNNFGSLFRFKANANLDLFFYNMNLRGIYIWEGRNLFLSTAHTESDIKKFIETVRATTDELIEHGFFKKKVLNSGTANARADAPAAPNGHERHEPSWGFTPSQSRFQNLSLTSEYGEAASHICLTVKMKGELQIDVLEKSLQNVVNHYDAFRLRFDLDSGRQWFEKTAFSPLHVTDVSGSDVPWDELEVQLRTAGHKPFDLQHEPPVRFHLYPVVEATAVFAMTCHHVALDGWSIAQFIENVAKEYSALVSGTDSHSIGDSTDGSAERTNGRSSSGTAHPIPPSMTFEQYLNHPEKFGTTRKTQNAQVFWENKWLDRKPRYIQWPTGKETALNTSLKGSRIVFDIEYGLYTKIKKTAQSLKLSPFMFMLGAFATLMKKLDTLQDAKRSSNVITIGTPAANRDLDGADKMVGNCANLLPMDIQLNEHESPLDLLKRVKSDMLQALTHMAHPYEVLEKKVGQPLFNVTFNVEPASELPDFGDVSLFMHPFPITGSEFDLTFNLTDLEYYYHGEADFKTDLLNDVQVTQWADEFVRILKSFVDAAAASATGVNN